MMRILILAVMLSTTQMSGMAQTKKEKTPHAHDFDFWLGEWTVYNYGTDQVAGHSRITSIIDSLGIQEFYKTTDGSYHGTSLNKYNAAKDRWEQYWVDNSGMTLFTCGGLQDDKMILQDAEPLADKPINRITWKPEDEGSVRQTWDQSKDGGETWTTVFDGKYVRERGKLETKE